jgi:hypothetical protein
MAGQAKRMFELDVADESSEPSMRPGWQALAPHLRVTQSVNDAFLLLLAGKFRAVDFVAGEQTTIDYEFTIFFAFFI